jgi:hypothetical protein
VDASATSLQQQVDFEQPKKLPRYKYALTLLSPVTPIVFHSLVATDSSPRLLYGHALSIQFEPSRLCVDGFGHMFHPHPAIGLALVHTHLVQDWGRTKITIGDDGGLLYEGSIKLAKIT